MVVGVTVNLEPIAGILTLGWNIASTGCQPDYSRHIHTQIIGHLLLPTHSHLWERVVSPPTSKFWGGENNTSMTPVQI